jgi:hypothetical protein
LHFNFPLTVRKNSRRHLLNGVAPFRDLIESVNWDAADKIKELNTTQPRRPGS